LSKASGESRARLRGVRGCLVAAAAAGACAVALTIPAGASASSVVCSGKVARTSDSGVPVTHALNYTVSCSEDFSAMSMVFSKSIDYFSPAPDVFDGSEPAPDDSMSCEGDFPGAGFGCNGSVGATHTVSGIAATERRPCPKWSKRRHKSRGTAVSTWVTVVTTELDKNGEPFQISSQPFRLQGPCTAHHHHRHG
jgi:hypothetical protein